MEKGSLKRQEEQRIESIFENEVVLGLKKKVVEVIRIVPNAACRWWQLKHVSFLPRKLGKISNLTIIFFNWVGSTTKLVSECPLIFKTLFIFTSESSLHHDFSAIFSQVLKRKNTVFVGVTHLHISRCICNTPNEICDVWARLRAS